MMAAAGKITVAEVEELVEPGEIDPDQIHTPGIYVQRIVRSADATRSASSSARSAPGREELNMALTREEMAQRAAQEI